MFCEKVDDIVLFQKFPILEIRHQHYLFKMKYFYLLGLITFFINPVLHAQKFNVSDVYEVKELYTIQKYRNNPPFGYEESILCPDSLKFIAVFGHFETKASIKPTAIRLITEQGEATPVGWCNDKGDAELSHWGMKKNLIKGQNPVFTISSNDKAIKIQFNDQSYDLPAAKTQIKRESATLDLLVKGVSTQESLENGYALIPAGVKSGKGMGVFKKRYSPQRGKIICLDLNIKTVPEGANLKEFAVFSDSAHQSFALASETWGRISDFGGVIAGDIKLYFIVGEDFTNGALHYRGDKVVDFLLNNI
ncbi:hypothetical protein PEDI_22440 [Persicobacter diffluens]|uniref:Uncharacterized protein n=2 Tax=Persicobacter diffluens TaxID=981 RepID=A0AAN5AKB6_9BACT|nr:hypothetical protein PEDI_22440 [Persicobacter diffluens]